jgi:hypothetical protein
LWLVYTRLGPYLTMEKYIQFQDAFARDTRRFA